MDVQLRETRVRERRALGSERCACPAPEGAPRARGDASGPGSWEQPRRSGSRVVSGSRLGTGLWELADRGAPALPPPAPPPDPAPSDSSRQLAPARPISAASAFSRHQRLFVWRPVAQLPSALPARSPQGASRGFLGFSGPDCSQKGALWAGHLPPQRCRRGLEAAPPRRRLIPAHASRTARPILAGMFSPPFWAPRTSPQSYKGKDPCSPTVRRGGGRGRRSLCLPSASLLLPPLEQCPCPPRIGTRPLPSACPQGSSGACDGWGQEEGRVETVARLNSGHPAKIL